MLTLVKLRSVQRNLEDHVYMQKVMQGSKSIEKANNAENQLVFKVECCKTYLVQRDLSSSNRHQ